jgi:hypothetical protein
MKKQRVIVLTEQDLSTILKIKVTIKMKKIHLILPHHHPIPLLHQ